MHQNSLVLCIYIRQFCSVEFLLLSMRFQEHIGICVGHNRGKIQALKHSMIGRKIFLHRPILARLVSGIQLHGVQVHEFFSVAPLCR